MAISLLGIVVFFALYLWISWQSARSLTSHAVRVFPVGLALWGPVIGLVALGVGLDGLNGSSWGSVFFYVSSGAAGWLPTNRAIAVVAGLVIFIAVAFGVQGSLAEAETPVVFVGTVGAIVIAFVWSAANTQQLRIAREDMARAAAINGERLRIARDLHDLLGHNLSLIALKSELAQRLVSVAPDRAASEMSDIEQVARTALREVREAVASYRQPTLASEFRGAGEMLAAAGIAYRYEGETRFPSAPTPAVESALAWAVREGVTNVIRHSAAHVCTIRVAHDESAMRVEVINDGKGSHAPGGMIRAQPLSRATVCAGWPNGSRRWVGASRQAQWMVAAFAWWSPLRSPNPHVTSMPTTSTMPIFRIPSARARRRPTLSAGAPGDSRHWRRGSRAA